MSKDVVCAKTGKTAYDDETIVEMHFACGHIESLCLDARRNWSHVHSHHELTRKAEILNAKIWAVRALIRKGADKTDELVQLIADMQKVEKQIFDYASNWLKTPLEEQEDDD